LPFTFGGWVFFLKMLKVGLKVFLALILSVKLGLLVFEIEIWIRSNVGTHGYFGKMECPHPIDKHVIF
jgi:hypothetical protein